MPELRLPRASEIAILTGFGLLALSTIAELSLGLNCCSEMTELQMLWLAPGVIGTPLAMFGYLWRSLSR